MVAATRRQVLCTALLGSLAFHAALRQPYEKRGGSLEDFAVQELLDLKLPLYSLDVPEDVRGNGTATLVVFLPGIKKRMTEDWDDKKAVDSFCDVLDPVCIAALVALDFNDPNAQVPIDCRGQVEGVPWRLTGNVTEGGKTGDVFPPTQPVWPYPSLDDRVLVAVSSVSFTNPPQTAQKEVQCHWALPQNSAGGHTASKAKAQASTGVGGLVRSISLLAWLVG
ncbi:hypothetical protein P8C59_009450 [Phyllachora maydis]|uniref:Uncharacterized protein n=1 Tax=Phyllachora maydis TaxID=1825666 RepID=A0AAD9MLA0_9PEZI|nr:hypothetical protein P8C59_009450 [Phyllachora maydis]